MSVTFNPFNAANPEIAALATLVMAVEIGLLGSIIYYLASRYGYELEWVEDALKPMLANYYRELSFLVALTATSGSLYMSNVLGWAPCRLCWFQRILVYPIVVLTATALVLDKKDVADYVMPLTMIGIPISIYHALIQRYSAFHSAGCSVLQVSCSTKYTFFYGYITIPVMAGTALAAVLFLMWRFSGE